MKRNTDVRIKLSTKEKEKIQKRADETGMNLSSYCRYLILNTTIGVITEA